MKVDNEAFYSNLNQMIKDLMGMGYAVVVLHPDNLLGISNKEVQAQMVMAGLLYVKQAINAKIQDQFDESDNMTDVEADADTFKSIGWGTDEDYRPDGDC